MSLLVVASRMASRTTALRLRLRPFGSMPPTRSTAGQPEPRGPPLSSKPSVTFQRAPIVPAGAASAVALATRLKEQYHKAGGCMSCLEHNKYACTGGKDCVVAQGTKEHVDVLNHVRELYLDTMDLAGPRVKSEYSYPSEIATNDVDFSSWGSYLASRHFNLAELDRTQRHLSKPLTFPLTIAQFLSRGPLPFNDEGIRVFDGIRNKVWDGSRPVRLCLLGARAEATLPAPNWIELAHLFPRSKLILHMVGPEIPAHLHHTTVNYSTSIQAEFSGRLYHNVHDDLMLSDNTPDLYVLFNPGLGHQFTNKYWAPTLKLLHESKRPVLITSHSVQDARSDMTALSEWSKLGWNTLLPQMLNPFRSLRPDVHHEDIGHIIWSNYAMAVVSGAT